MAPALHPSPLALSPREQLLGLEDWQLVVALLPPPDEDHDIFTPKEIAAVLGDVAPDTLHNHIRECYRDWEGHFRLNREQTIRVIKRYCKFGRRRRDRQALLALVAQKYASQASPLAAN
jgi:hypothetical protein